MRHSPWRVILMLASDVDALFQHAGTCGSSKSKRSISMLDELRADVASEAGQTMAEYAVVLGVITIAVVVTLGLLSTAIKNLLNNVIASL
jgi:Flp pilus assembly pilin Flp